MGNVVSIEKVKGYLRIPEDDCSDDPHLQMVLAGAEAQVRTYLGDTQLVVTEGLTQKFGAGALIWFLDNRPIVSVESIEDGGANTIESTRFHLREELGQVIFRTTVRVAVDSEGAIDRWTITYTAGQFATLKQVPGDIQLAISMLVARRYQRPEPGIQSMRTQASGTAYIPNVTNAIMPAECIELLAPYVRRSV